MDYDIKMLECYFACMATPLGSLLLQANNQGLSGVYWSIDNNSKNQKTMHQLHYGRAINPHIEQALLQLNEYFNGKRKQFDLPLSAINSVAGSKNHATDFKQLVWGALMHIEYGKTKTYGEIATIINRPKAMRAVGHACGCNPLSIIVPCHRVINKNTKIINYGGGVSRKNHLLALENSGY